MSYINVFCVAGVVALERGSRRNVLHAQGMLELHWPTSPAHARKLRQHFSCFIPLGRFAPQDGRLLSKLTLKPFEDGQTKLAVCGYLQKDDGLDHYKMYAKGFSREELLAAKREYGAVSHTYFKDKKLLTRANAITLAHQFLASYLPNITNPRPLFRRTILWMIQSKLYAPAANWVSTPVGKAWHPGVIESFWRIIHEPEEASMAMIKSIFFFWNTGDPRPINMREKRVWPDERDYRRHTQRVRKQRLVERGTWFEDSDSDAYENDPMWVEGQHPLDDGLPHPHYVSHDYPFLPRYWPSDDDPNDFYSGVHYRDVRDAGAQNQNNMLPRQDGSSSSSSSSSSLSSSSSSCSSSSSSSPPQRSVRRRLFDDDLESGISGLTGLEGLPGLPGLPGLDGLEGLPTSTSSRTCKRGLSAAMGTTPTPDSTSGTYNVTMDAATPDSTTTVSSATGTSNATGTGSSTCFGPTDGSATAIRTGTTSTGTTAMAPTRDTTTADSTIGSTTAATLLLSL